ncbi:hypothetical protein H8959_021303 [Pygathrix nigripes]
MPEGEDFGPGKSGSQMLSSFLSVSGVGQTAVCDLVSWPRGTIRYSPNGLGEPTA